MFLNAAKATLADNSSLLGGKAEGSLSVAYADEAGTASTVDDSVMSAIRGMIPDPGSGSVTADALSAALWAQIRELVGGGGGGGGETRRGSGQTNSSGALTKIYFDTPFPNECTSVQITSVVNYGASISSVEVYYITREGFSATGTLPSGDGYTGITFDYTAYGN
jgi:hypothetical protein